MNRLLITIFLMSMTLYGRAQSLEELINTALEKNYQLLILKNEATIAENNNTAGNAGQLPTVDLQGRAQTSLNNTRQTFADGTIREGTNASTSNINLSLMANWTAFNGFRVYAMKDRLGYLEDLGAVNAKFYIEQTIADVAMAYYQLIYEQTVLDNYKESLEVSSYRFRLEKKRREVGAGSGITYQQAIVDYQIDSIRYLTQLNTIKTIQIELNTLLTNDPENEVYIKDSLFVSHMKLEKDSLLNVCETNNKNLEAAKLNELIAETDLRIQKASRFPQIDLFAGVEYSKSFAEVGFINTNRNLGPVAGVSISFNLFNGGNTNREIKNSKLSLENNTYSKQQTDLSVKAEFIKLYHQYKSVSQRVVLAKSNVSSANKVFDIAQEQLKSGLINGYDFRVSQQNLLVAELTLAQLQYSLKSLEISIKRICGNTIESYL